MNLVAHQLLSFNNPEWQAGNHLGEVVKGKNYKKYEASIQKGILLHRFIDSYTDSHDIVKLSTKNLHGNHGKYSSVIVDIFYDYLLIKNWDKFSKVNFYEFKDNCYRVLENFMDLYPAELRFYTKKLIEKDWFTAYETIEGVEITLKKLSVRTKFENTMHKAVKDLYLKESLFEEHFLTFFPEILKECKVFLKPEN